jgi:DNA-binding CsgD family transcriptional regulator
LSAPRARDRLRLAIDVPDPALADRIAAALAGVGGLELVAKDDEPDALVVATLVGAPGAETGTDADLALTARELEVLALLAEGASNKEIGRRLGISTHTAKYHVASLLEKFDAVSRTDAVAHAARLGVINL